MNSVEEATQGKPVVRVQELHKTYGKTVAVENISFEVYEGEIFGMVGPNGAGKTTTIECIEGLRKPDKGSVEVLGLSPEKDSYNLRERTGVQLQTSALQDRIKVWEALDLYASFYSKSVNWEVLLDRLGLADKRNDFFDKLSGGQKQRVFVALALVNDPEVVFLDELTTGLDPRARHSIWDLVRDIQKGGKTVILTTHFMEEAERLCDRIAIVDHGRIVALDSPEKLIQSLGAENRIIFNIETATGSPSQTLKDTAGVTKVEQVGDRVVVYGKGSELAGNVVNTLTAKGIHFSNLRTEQPNLEDVFLTLTGREMEA
ncbi:MAG: ABC transporter ATP-binding protein [Candidatus Bathyarchaeia archaeon]